MPDVFNYAVSRFFRISEHFAHVDSIERNNHKFVVYLQQLRLNLILVIPLITKRLVLRNNLLHYVPILHQNPKNFFWVNFFFGRIFAGYKDAVPALPGPVPCHPLEGVVLNIGDIVVGVHPDYEEFCEVKEAGGRVYAFKGVKRNSTVDHDILVF